LMPIKWAWAMIAKRMDASPNATIFMSFSIGLESVQGIEPCHAP
jgi:hypothetical protein